MIKNKKIACFVALPHHTRFLWPVTDALEKQGARIIYFTTMSDYPFEMDLIKKGKECRILQGYATPETRVKVKKATERFFDLWFERCFEWDGLRHWPIGAQNTLIASGFEEVFCLEQFIEQEKPDMFIALHERNRWGKIIGHYAAKRGIPYVTFQEGDYYEDRLSFSGHTEYSTALLVWGSGIQERLTRLKSSPEKFVLTGNTHLASVRGTYFTDEAIASTKKELNIDPGKKVILFILGIQWAVIKTASIWETFMKGISDDVVTVFKWHPKVTYGGFKKDTEPLFREKFPSAIVLHNFDPYRLLPIADYCVTLGKTTLAVEALSFGKPLFSMPGTDDQPDHYHNWGISQSVMPIGNFKPLYDTIKDGVPEEIQKNVDAFLGSYFYKNNTVAIGRAVEVADLIFETRDHLKKSAKPMRKNKTSNGFTPGKTSFIIPSGDDSEALLASLTSLSQNVPYEDWEVIIVVTDSGVENIIGDVSGDLVTVRGDGLNISALYNLGFKASTGEYLVFMKPGMLFFKSDGFLEALRGGVAGMPIKKHDMSPYCFGIDFNFNSVPYMIREEGRDRVPEAVGGGLIGVHRPVLEDTGGFDETIDNAFAEADLCLSAKLSGYLVGYAKQSMGIIYRETFTGSQGGEAQSNSVTTGVNSLRDDEGDGWEGRIRFFAKWCGQLPKDDDYIRYAGDLLKV